MNRVEFNKFIGVILLLIVLTFGKKWFDYSFIFVWLGVIAGFYLPFIDYLFYAYILRPNNDISKNIRNIVSVRKAKELVIYVNGAKEQMEKLIIHTAYFQAVFSLLTFYVLTSSGGLFGRGLVYGFILKLFVGQILQFMQTKEINKWFTEMPFTMDKHKTVAYLYANGLILLVYTLML